MNSFYSIKFRDAAHLLLPSFLRGGLLFLLIYCMIKPLDYLYGIFIAERNIKYNELQYTGQVRLLEALLNKMFPAATEWHIIDGAYRDFSYIYKTAENRPVAFYTAQEQALFPLYLKTEIGFVDRAFYIDVPEGITGTETLAAVTAVVNRFKMPGKMWDFKFLTP